MAPEINNNNQLIKKLCYFKAKLYNFNQKNINTFSMLYPMQCRIIQTFLMHSKSQRK